MKEIEKLKPSKVLVFCSSSPNAKNPKSETGYCNEYNYPGESFWRPIPDKIEVPHPLGSKEEATGFKVARVIYPIDHEKYNNNYEWFCIRDSQWKTDQVPTRPEYLVQPRGLKKLRKIHAILELDSPYIVHLRRDGTKDKPIIQRNITTEEPLMPDIHKTPEQQPHSEKSQTSSHQSNMSSSSNDNGQSIKIKETNTIFRKNKKMKLDGAAVYFDLSGNKWRSNESSKDKDAIFYYSKASNRLVVIPKIIVDKYIFDPFFQKNSKGSDLSLNYEAFAINETDRRINLKFKIKNDRLLVNLKNGGKSIPLISLPKDYWPDISSKNIDIYSKIAEKILHICKDFSSGEGIVPL